jgi:hypothetical protein
LRTPFGSLLGGLQDHGVAARERDGRHPERHHRGEVEGRDAAHDAERLARRHQVDPRRDLGRAVALQQLRNPTGELHGLEAALNFTARIRLGLAVLAGDDLRQLVPGIVQQPAEAEHDLGALRERGVPPIVERVLRRQDGLVHLFDARERDPGALPPGGRIEDGTGAARAAVLPLAVDPVGDGLRHGSLLAVPWASSVSRRSYKSTRVIFFGRKW